MNFAEPWWLLAAAAFALGVGLLLRFFLRREAAEALLYSDLAFMRGAIGSARVPWRILGAALVAGAFALGASLARPHVALRLPAKDGYAMLCVDTSGSMASQDVSPSRSAASKAAARAFAKAVPAGTRVGIIAFSTNAELVQPLTADAQAVSDAIERIPDPNGATAIGDALALAAQQLPNRGRRVVVLITDGENNRGVDPLEVAKFLGAHHVPVYTIGIGTNDSGTLIPGTSEEAGLDEDALRSIADSSGGAYAKAADAVALRDALGRLGRTTVMELRPVDASLATACAGGVLVLGAVLAALGAGRFP
ncbi:MAG: VWA domain-containing protein [Candidatus Eremiobacteraeota bacterium]|nr:VWA domain-containing protein [Candidatus Eremiobacteraeota bacterium]